MIVPHAGSYRNGPKPILGVRLAGKTELLAAMKGKAPVAIAAGYVLDYATGKEVGIVGALYESGDCQWSEEDVYNIERNDMEVDPAFVAAMLGGEDA